MVIAVAFGRFETTISGAVLAETFGVPALEPAELAAALAALGVEAGALDCAADGGVAEFALSGELPTALAPLGVLAEPLELLAAPVALVAAPTAFMALVRALPN